MQKRYNAITDMGHVLEVWGSCIEAVKERVLAEFSDVNDVVVIHWNEDYALMISDIGLEKFRKLEKELGKVGISALIEAHKKLVNNE